MRCFWILPLILVVCEGEVSADGKGFPKEIRGDHFAFHLPAGSWLVKPEDLAPSFFPDTPWGRLYKRRVNDLDQVYVVGEGSPLPCLGLKVQPYRKGVGKAISYEEFARPERIEAYKQALIRQLQRHGLATVSVNGPLSSPEDGVIQFTCQFESSEGREAEEYYASILGSHEVVYLILFSSPPAKSPESASLFRQIVASLEFKEPYRYRPYPQNWWEERTWGKRVEDTLKLLALFFILYLGFSCGLESLSKWKVPVHRRAIRVMSALLSLVVCFAVFKWVEF